MTRLSSAAAIFQLLKSFFCVYERVPVVCGPIIYEINSASLRERFAKAKAENGTHRRLVGGFLVFYSTAAKIAPR